MTEQKPVITGPLDAVSMLSSLVDDISVVVAGEVSATPLTHEQKVVLVSHINRALVSLFLGEKMAALRAYIYEQYLLLEHYQQEERGHD